MRTTFVSEESPELPTPYMAVPPPFVKSFTESLRTAGYYCTNNGKTDYQFQAPFLAWDANGKPGTVDAIHWRNRPDPEQPFFAVFNLEDTHESRMWPENNPKQEGDHRPQPPTDPQNVAVPPYLPDTPAVRQTIARQYDNIAHNDYIVGKLLDQLEEDGLTENTMVILWSDHGEGLPRAKRFLYDSGIRVPLILRWPGKTAAGTTSDRLVSLIDLAPTVLSAAGIPTPCHIKGESLFQPPRRSFVFAHRDRLDGEYDKSRCIRSTRYKYIRNYFPGRERFGFIPYRSKHEAMQSIRLEQLAGNESFDIPCPPEEFFDLESDPFEMNNLAQNPDFAQALGEFQTALDTWKNQNDPDLAVSENQIAERVWPGGIEPITATPFAAIFNQEFPQGVLVDENFEISGPCLLQLGCASEGASIGFQIAGSDTWIPYQRTLRMDEGVYEISIKAERYGYAKSKLRTIHVTVLPSI